MALRLFIDAMSQPSRSVMIFLKCANVAHTIVITDIMKGKTFLVFLKDYKHKKLFEATPN